MNRIVISLPSDSSFNHTLANDISLGFEELGMEVRTMLHQPRGDDLRRLCDAYQPDAFFEMNRCRDELPELPKEIPHICWLVDSKGYRVSHFTGSEILYFFCWFFMQDHDQKGSLLLDWMPPGYNPRHYFEEDGEYLTDISFAGHMSPPWTRRELDRVIYSDSEWGTLKFEEVATWVEQDLHGRDTTGWGLNAYLDHSLAYIAARIGKVVEPDLTIQYDLSQRLYLRMARRHKLLNGVMAMNPMPTLTIHGTHGWGKWPEYAPYYRGYLDEPTALRRLYRTSRINLHEGPGVHFRSLDCMASGGVLFFMETPEDVSLGRLESIFQPDVHYIHFTPENFAEKATKLLENPVNLRQIAANAAQEVRQRHTWRHRAEKIREDLLHILEQ
ncbi:MAG: glycosyltransferase [Magnetococcus sp. DMHC-6]